jgi:hypothetical protein
MAFLKLAPITLLSFMLSIGVIVVQIKIMAIHPSLVSIVIRISSSTLVGFGFDRYISCIIKTIKKNIAKRYLTPTIQYSMKTILYSGLLITGCGIIFSLLCIIIFGIPIDFQIPLRYFLILLLMGGILPMIFFAPIFGIYTILWFTYRKKGGITLPESLTAWFQMLSSEKKDKKAYIRSYVSDIIISIIVIFITIRIVLLFTPIMDDVFRL